MCNRLRVVMNLKEYIKDYVYIDYQIIPNEPFNIFITQ